MPKPAHSPQVVILAGGLATRLRPLTSDRPKSMIEIHGKPFLQHQLELLVAEGLSRIVLCVGHLADQIVTYFGDGRRFGVEIRYSHDGPEPLGTAGALRRAGPHLSSWFLLMNGDSYLPFAFGDVIRHFQTAGLPGVMAVYRNTNRYGTSNVGIETGRVRRYDRTGTGLTYIDYGVTIMSHELLAEIPADRYEALDDLYRRLAESGRLGAFVVRRRFYEIGSHAGLQDFIVYMSRQARAATADPNHAARLPTLSAR